MKWFANECRRRREAISLLACGALPEADREEVFSHLAGCEHCQNYFAEIKEVAAPLATWKKSLETLEPDPAARLRWARAVTAASTAQADAPEVILPGWWRGLIWPHRRAWAGIAALWLVMWAINWGRPATDATTQNTTDSARTFAGFEEQRRMLAELLPPAGNHDPAEPPRRNLGPRSDRENQWMMG